LSFPARPVTAPDRSGTAQVGNRPFDHRAESSNVLPALELARTRLALRVLRLCHCLRSDPNLLSPLEPAVQA
jgi:hypothetical protein